jgi:NADH dehydrogenase
MLVTVFGGTGFLGQRVVRHLRDADFIVRIASRHPSVSHSPYGEPLDTSRKSCPMFQSPQARLN